VAFVGTAPALVPAAAGAQSAREAFDLARDSFLVADYRTSLERLSVVLDGRGLNDRALVEAHVLRARSLAGLGRSDAAAAAFGSVLRLDRRWRPTPGAGMSPEDVGAFRRAVVATLPPVVAPEPRRAYLAVVRSPWIEPAGLSTARKRPWYRRPLVLGLAGGLAVGGAVLLFDETPSAEASRLPDFPGPPE
jgi:hypothetical protein